MRGLNDIVKDNRLACQQGVIAPGSAVGVFLYTVKDRSGVVLATGLTDLEVAKRFNQIRSEVVIQQE